MEFFLKLKHWQLLGLLFFSQFVSMIVAVSLEEQPTVMLIGSLLSVGIFFGWFYALGINLNKRLPTKAKLNLSKFKWFMLILIAYSILFCVFVFYFWLKANRAGTFTVMLPFHFLSMFCMLYCLYFNAKSLKAVELQRPVTFGDCIEEFFLIWFFPIGIWIIQPRINKMFDESLQVKK